MPSREEILYEIGQGVYHAFIDILTGGGYPITREDIINSIAKAVGESFDDQSRLRSEPATATADALRASGPAPLRSQG